MATRSRTSAPLAAGALLGVLIAWWGPGGASLRRGARSLVRGGAAGGRPARSRHGMVLAGAGLGVWAWLRAGMPDGRRGRLTSCRSPPCTTAEDAPDISGIHRHGLRWPDGHEGPPGRHRRRPGGDRLRGGHPGAGSGGGVGRRRQRSVGPRAAVVDELADTRACPAPVGREEQPARRCHGRVAAADALPQPNQLELTAAEREASAALDLALRIGELMLRCGAGARQVESSVIAVAAAAGLDNLEVDITLQSLLVQCTTPRARQITMLRVVRSATRDFDRLVAVHEFVENLVAGGYDREEAAARLREIRKKRRGSGRDGWSTGRWACCRLRWRCMLGAGLVASMVGGAVGAVRRRSRLGPSAPGGLPEFYQCASAG